MVLFKVLFRFTGTEASKDSLVGFPFFSMPDDWVELPPQAESELLSLAVQKAGSERKLARLLSISTGTIYEYKVHHRRIPWDRFVRLRDFVGWLDIPFQRTSLTSLYQKGARITFQRLLKENRLEKVLQKARKKAAVQLKEWHANTKVANPSLYYSIQYSRFKKIGGYKCLTLRGELVRNEWEKIVADRLHSIGVLYEYEPCIQVQTRCVFPDFVFKKLVLECTAWKGQSKIPALRKKIVELTTAGFEVALVVPEQLKTTYAGLGATILMIAEVDSFIRARVAQTETGSVICSSSGAAGRVSGC